ncbi:ABC transporter permease subunit [Paenibacillus sp. WQ 127069]|uniref:ABC transporter permease subunit n=1 Tax=Paenibacillus baimaensis TaxID=2982185 RepID=A0ABT2ULM1_9BACL|nr:ABC transporter permease subunit [Paenibacillus sp. WQ 127069]MCU6795545.1 ABC transporter permease subunit [Paenibacillus sp. WQ 127069]
MGVTKRFLGEMARNGSVYLMFVPVGLLLLVFNYMPMGGLVIAFKNFDFTQGIFGSSWANPIFNNFKFLFNSEYALRALRNTIFLNLLFIFSGLIFEVSLALLLNEIRNKAFKKVAQSLTFLPYFISWIVVGVFTYNLLTDVGAVNSIISFFGFEPIDFFSNPGLWPAILVLIMRWKVTGYGSVIYLAALTGIDASYFEAAAIDGANKWQQIRYISLPMLKPTIIILTLLAIGRIMNADFGMFYAVIGDASTLYPTTDVIDTFVYRGLRVNGDIGMSAAAGFLQSIGAFILVLGSNLIARKIDKDSALF